jgi:D-alanyl-D-alanine carboxypeptidase
MLGLLFLASLLSLAGCADDSTSSEQSQDHVTDGHADAGAESGLDLAAKADALQAALETWRDDLDVTGASAVIKTADGQVWEGAAGLADVKTNRPSTPDYHYRIASITKHIVAAAFMSMVEDGQLSLDDKLSDYREYPNGENITLRMLLNHSSGILDYQTSERFVAAASANLTRRFEPDEIIQYAIDDGPKFEPGAGFHYSNTGYLLLGQVLEKVSGKKAHEVLRERVFAPAGMRQSYLSPAETLPEGERLATGYSNAIEGITLDFSKAANDVIETIAWTAGGVMSTASDVADFGLAMMAHEVVSEASSQEMEKVGPRPNTTEGADYGLGTNVIEHAGLRTVGHGGGMPGFRTRLMYVPELSVSIAVLSNGEEGDMLAATRRLLDVIVAE